MSSLYFADQRSQQEQVQEEAGQEGIPRPVDGISVFNNNSDTAEGYSIRRGDSVVSTLTEQTGQVAVEQPPDAATTTATTTTATTSRTTATAEITTAQVMLATATRFPTEEQAATATSCANDDAGDSTSASANNKQGANHEDRRRFMMLLFCLSCIMLVGGGVGAGVGVGLRNNNNDDNSPTTPVQKEQPPTMAPTAPIKELPTEPTATSNDNQPTDPTSVAAPSNDQCVDATMISTQAKVTTFGSTVGATTTTTATATTLQSSPQAECGISSDLQEDGPGVWYQITGQGTVVTASTCGDTTDFDTKLSVYEEGGNGSKECENLVCVAHNDDATGNNIACGTLSTVTWLSQPGKIYFVLVRGFEGATGSFELTTDSGPVVNDFCDGAIEVVPNDGGFTLGSTVPATLDYVGTCDGVTTTAPGVWYRLQGTGGSVIVSTCHATLLYDTKLSIFEGSSCGGLLCYASDDDGCAGSGAGGGTQSRVEFETEVGKMYFILVHGYKDETGQFQLQVATPDNLYNDFCEDARPVALGTYTRGDNLLAKFDFDAPAVCGDAITISGPTVWFQVIGTGGDIMASVCDVETTFDTQMSVFAGSCTALRCIGGNDDSEAEECGFTSELQWTSEPFQIYLIAVHGYDNATGTFGFYVEDRGGAPVFDTCEGAGGPVSLGHVVPVALADAATSILDCGSSTVATATVQGSWLYTIGHGGSITASVCEANPIGAKLFVYDGDCSGLACMANTTDACSVTWTSVPNQGYYMFIRGAGEGDYELSLTTTGPPPVSNDLCPGAIPLEINIGESVFGNTITAKPDSVPGQFCGEEITAPSVWYSVVGTGFNTSVGLCVGTDFDTKLSVFKGDCENLECIGGNDDYCDLHSAYEWFAEVGVTYYALIHGFDDSTGNFGIIAITQ